MPAQELAFPVGASTVVLQDSDGVEYTIDDSFLTSRTGEDGTVKILPVFTSDYFSGEQLEDLWKIQDTTDLSSATHFSIISAELSIAGDSSAAGAAKRATLVNNGVIPMVEDVVIDVHLKASAKPAANQIYWAFLLGPLGNDDPWVNEPNRLTCYLHIDSTNTKFKVDKEIGGTSTNLYDSGYDADLEGTFRFKIQEETDGHTHVYLKQGAGSVDESTDEVAGSPFALGLSFKAAYPAYQFINDSETVITCTSEKATVTYPDFNVDSYALAAANEGLGDVKVYDEIGAGGSDKTAWQEVKDWSSHAFTGDLVICNGLIRVYVDEAAQNGLKLYYYTGSAWVQVSYLYPNLTTDATSCQYPAFDSIQTLTPEKVSVDIWMLDSATDDRDNYIKLRLSIERGQMRCTISNMSLNPSQPTDFYVIDTSTTRFVFLGDDSVHDADVVNNPLNTTMSDNFMVQFDPDGDLALVTFGVGTQPDHTTARYQGLAGKAWVENYLAATLPNIELYWGVTVFPKVADLFKEAESATNTATARSYMDGEGNAVDSVCEAQPDRVGGIDIDSDAFGFWNGNDVTISQSTTYGLKMEGTESSKLVVDDIGDIVGAWEFYKQYGVVQDWSGEDYIGFWFYGSNSGDTFKLYLEDTTPNNHTENWTDNFTGWRWIAFPLADFTGGGIDLTDIKWIIMGCASPSGSASQTYYIDMVTVYTVNTDTLWAVVAGGGSIDVSTTGDPQVGSYEVELTSGGAGANTFKVTPTDALANILKFDSLKFHAKSANITGNLRVRLMDTDGDNIYKDQAITSSHVEYTLALPHSDTDLQGWTNTSFDYSKFEHIRFEWTDGGVEVVYLDGIRFYIGTTTARGRGETLSGSSAVVLGLLNELNRYSPVAGTNIPEGRYLMIIRAKDTDQVASDAELLVQNQTDTKYRNKEFAEQNETLTGSFAFYFMEFYISDADVSGTDTIILNIKKDTATENTIFVDYFLIIPLGNGDTGPQEIAHNPFRTVTKKRKVYEQ
tara:strand:- start:631 stop:3651 length:3021 start_codon:yes stop_codon:yes gene_type:complete